jgi:hypothetical protein
MRAIYDLTGIERAVNIQQIVLQGSTLHGVRR